MTDHMADTNSTSSDPNDLLLMANELKNQAALATSTDLISTDAMDLYDKVMTGVWFLICVVGVVFNVITLRTFVRIGLDDSVTVAFFSLAISDFNVCNMALIDMVCCTIELQRRITNEYYYLPPIIPSVYLTILRKIFSTETVLITTYLAVQRCFCVVFPFHVKSMFSRSRTVGAIVIITVVTIATHILLFTEYTVSVGWNPVFNATQVFMNAPSSSAPAAFMSEVVMGIGMNITCQGIVLLCLVVLAVSLKRSVRFRKSVASSATSDVLPSSKAQVKDVNADRAQKDAKGQNKSRDKTHSKETQAVIQVSLVSFIFVVTNIPYLGFGVINILFPQFNLYGVWHNFYILIVGFMFTAELINSAVNLVVYYKYNTKFRTHCFGGRK